MTDVSVNSNSSTSEVGMTSEERTGDACFLADVCFGLGRYTTGLSLRLKLVGVREDSTPEIGATGNDFLGLASATMVFATEDGPAEDAVKLGIANFRTMLVSPNTADTEAVRDVDDVEFVFGFLKVPKVERRAEDFEVEALPAAKRGVMSKIGRVTVALAADVTLCLGVEEGVVTQELYKTGLAFCGVRDVEADGLDFGILLPVEGALRDFAAFSRVVEVCHSTTGRTLLEPSDGRPVRIARNGSGSFCFELDAAGKSTLFTTGILKRRRR